jgi:hypothetical protein
MNETTETTPPADAKLDRQVRLRCTAEEKAHLDTAARDAGHKTLSDYLRPVLFGGHVLIVGDSDTEFTLVPAHSALEDEREEAMTNLQGLLQLGLLARQAAGTPTSADAQPSEAAPFSADGEAPAAVEATAPPVEVAAPPVQPELEPVPRAVPAPEENYDAFLARRKEELRLQGRSDLVAGYEAEAEWRALLEAAQSPAVPPVEAADAAFAAGAPQGHGYCAQCGHALAGTPFCSHCGNPVA